MEFNKFGRISINVISFNPINFLSINRGITPPLTLNTIVNQICIGRVLQVNRVFLKPTYIFLLQVCCAWLTLKQVAITNIPLSGTTLIGTDM